MSLHALVACLPVRATTLTPTKLELARLTLDGSLPAHGLQKSAEAALIARQVHFSVQEGRFAIELETCLLLADGALLTVGNHVLARETASRCHVEAVAALARARVQVLDLIGNAFAADAPAAFDRQKFRGTPRAHISAEALLAAGKRRAATLALALVEVEPRLALGASAGRRGTHARDAAFDQGTRGAAPLRDKVPLLTLEAPAPVTVQAEVVPDFAVGAGLVQRVKPPIALQTRRPVVADRAVGIDYLATRLAY